MDDSYRGRRREPAGLRIEFVADPFADNLAAEAAEWEYRHPRRAKRSSPRRRVAGRAATRAPGRPIPGRPVLSAPILPRSDGAWDGRPGNSDWVSFKVDVNRVTGSRPVPYRNNQPVLQAWAVERVRLATMRGGATDYEPARAGLMRRYPGRWSSARHVEAWEKGLRADNGGNRLREPHTWHHEPDVETMSLVPTALHANVPHSGGSSRARRGETPFRGTAPFDTNPV